jgi:hypothetical protein
MVNVIDGVAFDSYYIHYDAEGIPAFISHSVNGDIGGETTLIFGSYAMIYAIYFLNIWYNKITSLFNYIRVINRCKGVIDGKRQ